MVGLLLFTLPINLSAQSKSDDVWEFEKSSAVNISGTTNVNRFFCSISQIEQPDTVTSFLRNDTTRIFYPHQIIIAINTFDCNNKVMESDLQKTLKSNEYPFIKLSLISLTQNPKNNKATLKFWLEMAGKKLQYISTGNCQINNQNLWLSGSKTICLSHYNIEPPQKFMGMVVVNDEIEVNFEFAIKKLNNH